MGEEQTQSEQARIDFLISYTNADRVWAEWIAATLEAEGYQTHIAFWDVRPGSNVIVAMDEAITQADRTLLVLSVAYLADKTLVEWTVAWQQDPRGKDGRVVPVRIERCAVEGLLSSLACIDLVGLGEQEARERLLVGVKPGRAKPSTVLFPVSSSPRPLDRAVFPGTSASTEQEGTLGETGEARASVPVMGHLAHGPQVDWGEALSVPTFYGREQELALLTHWVIQERCRVVSLLGLGGIGKSALAVTVMYQLAEQFEVVIFRSLRDAPSCEELLEDCLQVLAPQHQRAVPLSLQRCIRLLLEHLRTSRILLVLDNLESVLEKGDVGGRLRSGCEGYGRLLRQIGETAHQSCVLLTSREKLADLRPLEGKRSPVRSLQLSGLDPVACEQLFTEKDIVGIPQDLVYLVEAYAGNPLALKMVAETIVDLFGGLISQFLAEGTLVFGSISDLLREQCARLSALEQTILCWLAIVREPVTLDELLAQMVVPPPRFQVLEALDGLRRRSLIERGQYQSSFTLQSVVLEYETTVLIEVAARELQQGELDRLIQHGLEQAHAREYIRQAQ